MSERARASSLVSFEIVKNFVSPAARCGYETPTRCTQLNTASSRRNQLPSTYPVCRTLPQHVRTFSNAAALCTTDYLPGEREWVLNARPADLAFAPDRANQLRPQRTLLRRRPFIPEPEGTPPIGRVPEVTSYAS